MSVKYNIVERKNPQDRAARAKYYAIVKADGAINLKELSREISSGSTTVSDTEVLAVLNDLNKTLVRHLSTG